MLKNRTDTNQFIVLKENVLLQVRPITKTHPLWQNLIASNKACVASVLLHTDVALVSGGLVEFDFRPPGGAKIFYRGRGRVVRAGESGTAVRVLEVMCVDKVSVRKKAGAAELDKRKMAALPENAKIEELLTSLIGETINVKDYGRAMEANPAVVGVYVNDEGSPIALAVTDIATANNVGAAMGKIPAGAIAAAIRENIVEKESLENYQEILNIGASLLNSAETAHVKFSMLHVPPADLPAPIATLMKAPITRKDVELTIPLYGTGVIALMLI